MVAGKRLCINEQEFDVLQSILDVREGQNLNSVDTASGNCLVSW